jgi:FemAB-related protein (PEP-CTERM system-associated)
VRIEPLDRTSAAEGEWDAFVRSQDGWTHFHLAGWRGILEQVHRHRTLYRVARDTDGRIAGVLPLVRVPALVRGHYLVSMPYLNHGGPLGTADAVRALANDAVSLAMTSKPKLLELRSRAPLPLALPVSHRKVSVLLPLPEREDQLLKGFDPKLRSQVRRAAKEGATVRFGADQVGPFFEVFAHHMRDLGTPTQPLALFRRVVEAFPDTAWVGVVWLGDVPIAGGAGLRWGTEFEMTWASSLRAHSRIAPNMLLYWAFMQRAIAEGVRTFNFGRCTPGAGTHRFKRQWGGTDEVLWWYGYSPGAEAPGATPSPEHGPLAWAPRVWRHLPTPLATAVGPRIIRHLP